MALEFLKGAQQPTAQEAVAYVDSGEANQGDDDTDFAGGEVVANISDLVAVDGPEDVLAYVNGALDDTDLTGTVTSDEVADVDVSDGDVVLNPGLTYPDAGDDLTTAPQAVNENGGVFFNVDEAVEGSTLDPNNIENSGDFTSPALGDDTNDNLYFTYTGAADDLTYAVALTDGVQMVVQASGY